MHILKQTNKQTNFTVRKGGWEMWSLFWIAIILLKLWGSITNEEKGSKYWRITSSLGKICDSWKYKDQQTSKQKRNRARHVWPMEWIDKGNYELIIILPLPGAKEKSQTNLWSDLCSYVCSAALPKHGIRHILGKDLAQ